MLAEVTALFERLLAELPPGTAALNVYTVPRNGGTVIELKPTNRAAADLGVHCDESHVFSFGFGPAQWELPHERRYRHDEKDILTEIEEMSRAVIAGDCEVSGRRFSLTGRIYVGDYTYEVRELHWFPQRARFSTRHYAPYVQSDPK